MANIFKFMAKKPKKTAMQLYIQDLQNIRKNAEYAPFVRIIDLCIEKAELHLLDEKQQIIDANNAGFKACRKNIPQNAPDYYFETFKLD